MPEGGFFVKSENSLRTALQMGGSDYVGELAKYEKSGNLEGGFLEKVRFWYFFGTKLKLNLRFDFCKMSEGLFLKSENIPARGSSFGFLKKKWTKKVG